MRAAGPSISRGHSLCINLSTFISTYLYVSIYLCMLTLVISYSRRTCALVGSTPVGLWAHACSRSIEPSGALHIYMYVYIYMVMYTYIYTYIHTYICTYIYLSMQTYIYIYISLSIYRSICTYIYIYYVCMYAYSMYLSIYIDLYILYIYVYTIHLGVGRVDAGRVVRACVQQVHRSLGGVAYIFTYMYIYTYIYIHR